MTTLHLQHAARRMVLQAAGRQSAVMARPLSLSALHATTGFSSPSFRGMATARRTYATAKATTPNADSPQYSTQPGAQPVVKQSSTPQVASISPVNPDNASPTISNRLPAEDNRSIEDWVLYHPVYTEEEVKSVKVVRHIPKTFGDRLAARLVKTFRYGFDLVTGYKHSSPEEALAEAAKQGKKNLSLEEMRKMGLVMDPNQWLSRILFLESIAGVPGMVAGTLRHLRSLRLMKRDGGFIHQLLEEAENERMHLLSFMKLAQPSLLFRAFIIGAQGVFYNLFFLSYLMSPKTCHRFVGVLEEEAVVTYTLAIKEIEEGRLPEWKDMPAPQIAKDYWRMKDDATLLDVIYAVRSDEAGHRFANHTFANVKDQDFNPMALRQPDGRVQGTLPGFSREEGLEWYEQTSSELLRGREKLIKEGEQKKSA